MTRAEEIAREALSIRTLTSAQMEDLVPHVAAALESYAREERQSGYLEGRIRERERCAKIVLDFPAATTELVRHGQAIAARIREGK